MAALPLRASQPPPAALAAAAYILRPSIRICMLGRRGPSFPLLKVQARRQRGPFHSNCAERADSLGEPDQQREPESENQDSDEAATSGNCPLVDKFLKIRQEARAASGIRVTPDMFITEKKQIFSYWEELMFSNGCGTMDAREMVMASIVCTKAQEALNLASVVMDFARLRRGTIQFSQHTVDQMVRTYAAIFCNVAKDAYYDKFKMETTLSFLGALRGLGAVYHILAQDTVSKLKDGRLKNSITYDMDKHSQDFNKEVKYLEDVIVKIKPQEFPQTLIDVVWHGLMYARIYIARLAHCLEAALGYLKD
ncbi:hypothetical protein BS78_09G078800 [Paspalum vaginatum]|nr:hypothetical protein BS78_09G078800 [Paspalum vaginatum]